MVVAWHLIIWGARCGFQIPGLKKSQPWLLTVAGHMTNFYCPDKFCLKPNKGQNFKADRILAWLLLGSKTKRPLRPFFELGNTLELGNALLFVHGLRRKLLAPSADTRWSVSKPKSSIMSHQHGSKGNSCRQVKYYGPMWVCNGYVGLDQDLCAAYKREEAWHCFLFDETRHDIVWSILKQSKYISIYLSDK